MSSLFSQTLLRAHRGLKQREFSAVELTQSHFDRIHVLNPDLNAYVTLDESAALESARQIDEKIAQGQEIGVLEGMPAALKDIFNTKGVRTTCCSPGLKNFVPPYDATSVSRLKDQGMVLLGKTNLDEFACGASTEHSCFGFTKNPWNSDYVAGGSSGGSAAAVASDLALYALGTDTGGSIRQPASFCSVVGLKVTYGRVSRFGVTALASSWDTIGSFGKTVEDVTHVLKAIAGKDAYDATTPSVEVPDYPALLTGDVRGLKVGVPSEYFGEGLEESVKVVVWEAIRQLEKLGASIHEISLPMTKYAVATYYILMPAELSANLARFDGIRFGAKPQDEAKDLMDYYCHQRSEAFGNEIKRRIMMGTYVLSAGYYDAYYSKAQKVRTKIIEDFDRAFESVDVICGPVSPIPPFKAGEKKEDPLAMYLADALSIPASAAGIPALSVPCGFSPEGLPIGLQITGPQFQEARILNVGYAYERATQWHMQKPKL